MLIIQMILTVEMQLIGEKILYNVFHLVNISFPFFLHVMLRKKLSMAVLRD